MSFVPTNFIASILFMMWYFTITHTSPVTISDDETMTSDLLTSDPTTEASSNIEPNIEDENLAWKERMTNFYTRENIDIAEQYLSRYGYFRKGKSLGIEKTDPLQTREAREPDGQSEEIRMFQSYFGLTPTGKLNEETLNLMSQRRCGVADIPVQNKHSTSTDSNSPYEFRLFDTKWENSRLTWRLNTETRQLDRGAQLQTIRDAFSMWASAAPLTFKEATQNEPVDIDMSFGRYHHGDSYPFDGRSKVLAHAFGPGQHSLSGDVHFDDDEVWSLDPKKGADFLVVATHELGHSLGLAHSNDPNAVMYPVYLAHNDLGQDDILGIQALYGKKLGGTQTMAPRITNPPTTRQPVTRSPIVTRRPGDERTTQSTTALPSVCNIEFDAVVNDDVANSHIYTGIKNDRIYRFSKSGILPRYPASLDSRYPGAPRNAEAVFSVPEKRATYFLKGNRLWKYTNFVLEEERALESSHFPETIRFVITLMDSYHQRRIFVFGNTWFLEYQFENVVNSRPIPHVIAQYWPGVPRDVKFAITWSDQNTYLVSQNSHVILDEWRRPTKFEGSPVWMQSLCQQMHTAQNSGHHLSSYYVLMAVVLTSEWLIVKLMRL